jgi:hypothetical protein
VTNKKKFVRVLEGGLKENKMESPASEFYSSVEDSKTKNKNWFVQARNSFPKAITRNELSKTNNRAVGLHYRNRRSTHEFPNLWLPGGLVTFSEITERKSVLGFASMMPHKAFLWFLCEAERDRG